MGGVTRAEYDNMAYEPGDPKRADYAERVMNQKTCVICAGVGGHYAECVEAPC